MGEFLDKETNTEERGGPYNNRRYCYRLPNPLNLGTESESAHTSSVNKLALKKIHF